MNAVERKAVTALAGVFSLRMFGLFLVLPLMALYANAFEVEPRWLVESASRRQKWIDQAQSLNLYINNASGKKLDITYRMAWLCGL